MIIISPLHTYKSDDRFIAAQVDGETLVLAESRNEEAASEGNYGRLITVIPLQHAIAIAKAVLASQQQAELDAMVDAMYERHQYRMALIDSALMHDITF